LICLHQRACCFKNWRRNNTVVETAVYDDGNMVYVENVNAAHTTNYQLNTQVYPTD
jgi:hypothetical protein